MADAYAIHGCSEWRRSSICTACPVASTLWLKIFLHRGIGVQVTGSSHAEIHGPAVTAVHQLLKNNVVERVGPRPYLLVTDVAADHLRLTEDGLEHDEEYPGSARIAGRIIGLE